MLIPLRQRICIMPAAILLAAHLSCAGAAEISFTNEVQAVIAKALYSVSSYKNWADKAKDAFDKDG